MNHNNTARMAILKSVSMTVLFVSLFSFTALSATAAHAETDASTTAQADATASAPAIETVIEIKAPTTTDAVIAITVPTTTDSVTASSTDEASTTEPVAAKASFSLRSASVAVVPNTTVIASAVTCSSESDLPNWGNGGPSVTAATAATYVAAHPSCQLVSGWNFQWGFNAKSGFTGVKDPGAAFIGPVSPAPVAYNTWNSFGPTNAAGIATASIGDFNGATSIWFREQLPTGYVPFSEAEPGIQAIGHKNQVSAEMYCSDDVLNFDNYDAIYNIQHGLVYYCVTFNALTNNGGNGGHATNTPPVITITGSNPVTITVNTNYADQGATATDTEDGNITSHITASSSVSTTTIGTYKVVYSVTDSGGLSASSTRVVNVVAANNGGGGNASNTPPVITIVGNNPETINVGTNYTDAGATASDTEDGNITALIRATSTVSTTTVGSYTVTYVVTDSGGLTATSTRTVNVVDPTTNTGGNGGGGTCTGTCTGAGPATGFGGGGGGGGGGAFFAGTFGTGGSGNLLPAPALSCPLLRDFLRIDFNNDPTEVVKLQGFLQRAEGLDVDVTGTFDQKTLAGVNAFQTKYLTQVMGPWGASRPSGYVYITTKKKINEIACATAFIINPSEQSIIDAYKANQAADGQNGIDNSTGTNPDIGLNATSSSVASDNGFFNNPNTAGAANASILARFWSFLKGLFGLN